MKLESRNNSHNTWKAFDDNKTISRVSKKGESRLNWLGPHFIFANKVYSNGNHVISLTVDKYVTLYTNQKEFSWIEVGICADTKISFVK